MWGTLNAISIFKNIETIGPFQGFFILGLIQNVNQKHIKVTKEKHEHEPMCH